MTAPTLLDLLFERFVSAARELSEPASDAAASRALEAVRASGWRPLPAQRDQGSLLRRRRDADLARAFQAGDATAFDELFSRHHGKLIAAARRAGCGADAEDIAQEAWIALSRTHATSDPQFNTEAFLFRVVRNRAVTLNLRRRREPSSSEQPEAESLSPGPLAELIARYTLDRIARVIEARCTPDEQDVLALRHAGMSPGEIAAELGISPGNVRVIHHRARTKLRAALDEEGT